MREDLPGTVRGAVALTWALVAAMGVTALLTVLLKEDVIRAWAGGSETARVLVEQGGVEALEGATVAVPAFVPVAIVSFVMILLLAWVLTALLVGQGAGGARIGLTGLALLAVVMTVFGLRYDQPPLFTVMTVVVLGLEVALLTLLWHPRTTGFVRGE
ncbi:hypothetical protein [Nocardioides sp.]|uniref:hypothetical protein n=1 Tax=Nocardioides sp. TaxID=35761 RepID=UPI002735780C|nr:hypothetical protein [Nocardioides sp.]MDP3889701.1 hypothetical protein [Nocardioides sp.]